MDELFTLHPSGLFLRGEAIKRGYRDRHLAHALKERKLARVRHGTYVSQQIWQEANDVDRYKLRCRAVLLTHGDRVALSHTSAAVVHGLRLFEPDLSQVHVVRLDDGGGRQLNDVRYHEGFGKNDEMPVVDGMRLVDPVLSALGTASLVSVEAGVVVLDSLFDLDLGTPEQLAAAYERRSRWPFSQRLQMSVRLARVGSQSVGESRFRHLCFCHHLPEPQLQWHVYDAEGRLVGITDFAWPEHRLLGEFDGKQKYHELLKPGQTPQDAVFAEKKREDRLREVTDFGMIRFVWADLYSPEKTAARVRSKLGSRFAE
jgi:hypothetical protein